MKIIKKFGIVIGSVLLVTGTSLSYAQDASMKVAVVNVQQVLQQSPKVAQLSKKLESQFKTRQTKISEEQKNLQDDVDKFKKESATMSQKEKDAMQKKIAANRSDLMKQVVGYQQDLQKEQSKIMQDILGDLNGIVSQLAKTKDFSLVLDSQAVIYVDNGNDITKEVIQQFNKKS